MIPASFRRCHALLFSSIVASLIFGTTGMLCAAEQGLPVGKWEIKREIKPAVRTAQHIDQAVFKDAFAYLCYFAIQNASLTTASHIQRPQSALPADTRGFRGSLVYTYDVILKRGGVGATIVTMEYRGTDFDDKALLSNHGHFSEESKYNEGDLARCQRIRGVIERPITRAAVKGNFLYLQSKGNFKLVAGDPPGCTIQAYGTAGTRFSEAAIDHLLASVDGVDAFAIDGNDLVSVSGASKRGTSIRWTRVN